jgi:hypothetical protein
MDVQRRPTFNGVYSWRFLASSPGLLVLGNDPINVCGISYITDKSVNTRNTVVAFYLRVILGVVFIFPYGRQRL